MTNLLQHPLWLLSIFVYSLLLVGVLYRRRRRLHISMMTGAIAIDLAMVLYLEIKRGVVESIPSRELTSLLVFHIALSVVVLALYGVQIVTGIRNARGRRSTRHLWAAGLLLVVRLGNLITSFFVVQTS